MCLYNFENFIAKYFMNTFLKDGLYKGGQGSNGQKVHDRPFTKE